MQTILFELSNEPPLFLSMFEKIKKWPQGWNDDFGNYFISFILFIIFMIISFITIFLRYGNNDFHSREFIINERYKEVRTAETLQQKVDKIKDNKIFIACLMLNKKDYHSLALKSCQKASRDNPKAGQAQLIVGMMYLKGKGTEINKEQAEKWFNKACQSGEKLACDYPRSTRRLIRTAERIIDQSLIDTIGE